MEDEQSTEAPAEDLILSTLSGTEDTETSQDETEVVETQDDESAEAETKPEVEQQAEDDSEDQAIDPKEEARRRYEERQAYREEQRSKIAKETETYTSEAQDEYDQRLRNMEVQRYTELIENTQDKLVADFERAKADPSLQMFNPDSKEFDQDIYDYAMENYNEAKITYDSNGSMVGIKSPLYEHLNRTAGLYQKAIKSGQIQQVKAGRQMRSNSDIKPAANPKNVEKDVIADILKSD